MNTLILYDTVYGHNFELGGYIHQNLLPDSSLLPFKESLTVKLDNIDLLILCPCTSGEGQLTVNEEKFYNYLSEFSLKSLTYYIAGIGDQNFGRENFANAVNIFDQRLQYQHARQLGPSLKIDYEDIDNGQQIIAKEISKYLKTRK